MKLRHPIPQTTSKQVLSHTPGRGFNYPNLSTPWVAESPSVQKWLQPHCIPCKGALCGIAWHCVGAPWTPSIHSQMLKISGGIPSSYTWNFGWYRDSFNWSSFFFIKQKKDLGIFCGKDTVCLCQREQQCASTPKAHLGRYKICTPLAPPLIQTPCSSCEPVCDSEPIGWRLGLRNTWSFLMKDRKCSWLQTGWLTSKYILLFETGQGSSKTRNLMFRCL